VLDLRNCRRHGHNYFSPPCVIRDEDSDLETDAIICSQFECPFFCNVIPLPYFSRGDFNVNNIDYKWCFVMKIQHYSYDKELVTIHRSTNV
jgi:hypothetical protein